MVSHGTVTRVIYYTVLHVPLEIPYLSDLWHMRDRPNILGAPHLSHLSDQLTSKIV